MMFATSGIKPVAVDQVLVGIEVTEEGIGDRNLPCVVLNRLPSADGLRAPDRDFLSGRGPIKLISPLKIFQSWGSSSILERRKILPNLVTRASPCWLHTTPVSSSAFLIIVRNFRISNSAPFNPTRFCR